MTTTRFSLKQTVIFSLLPLAAIFLLLETGGRIIERFLPSLVVDSGMGFDEGSRLFVPHEGSSRVRVTNPLKTAQFVQQWFPMPKPAGVYRIAVLGESSVYYLNPELVALADKLAVAGKSKGKKIDIINAGGLSYGSQRLVLIARELLEYDLDLLIIYMGNNEFEEVEQLQHYAPATVAAQNLLGHSAIFRVFRDMIARRWIQKLKREHDEQLLATAVDYETADRMNYSPIDARLRMEAFRKNLSDIVASFLKRKISVLIGTVPSNYIVPKLFFQRDVQEFGKMERLLIAGQYKDAKRFAGAFMAQLPHRHQSSPVENLIIHEVARDGQIPLIDMERIISDAEPHGIPGETLFMDNCHLNDQGRVLWIRAFENKIREVPSFREWNQR